MPKNTQRAKVSSRQLLALCPPRWFWLCPNVDCETSLQEPNSLKRNHSRVPGGLKTKSRQLCIVQHHTEVSADRERWGRLWMPWKLDTRCSTWTWRDRRWLSNETTKPSGVHSSSLLYGSSSSLQFNREWIFFSTHSTYSTCPSRSTLNVRLPRIIPVYCDFFSMFS